MSSRMLLLAALLVGVSHDVRAATCAHSLAACAELGNRADYIAADVPCAGTMTARAAARMYAALIGEVDGVRLVSPARLGVITAVVSSAADRVLGAPIAKCLGYFSRLPEMGTGAGTFGCKGVGGSVAFADPARAFSFAFTPNRITAAPRDLAARLAEHTRAALGI